MKRSRATNKIKDYFKKWGKKLNCIIKITKSIYYQ